MAHSFLTNPNHLAEQYSTDENLRVRYEAHQLYTVGPQLEPAIDEVLNLTGNESLLDVGTGPGGFPARLIEQGHRGRIVGIDQSPGMIAKARASCPRGEFFQANAEHLPFADESFDVVTARHMLYHVPDIVKALAEICRVMRKGGRFLALTNALDYMHEYFDAIREAMTLLPSLLASNIAETVSTPTAAAFTEVNGKRLVCDAFGNANVTFLESKFVFHEAEPVVRYFNSSRTLKRASIEEWKEIERAMRHTVESRVKAGPWSVSKRVVFLTAQRP
jgi:ubiquinone/menaquinone biosynthesis C-methylase UbiE